MAVVLSGLHGSSPSMLYELHANQTASSGSNRTIKMTFKAKVNGGADSVYGYPLRVRFFVNGTAESNATGYITVKGTEYWNGTQALRSFESTVTVNVGTTASKSISVGFQLQRSDLGSTSWATTKHGSFTVGSTNSAPYFGSSDFITFKENSSSGATITAAQNGTENSKKIGENVSSIYMSWPAAKDAEGNSLTYEVWYQSNESSWSKITDVNTTSYTHSIGSGNEGRSYDYYIKAKDTGGLYSGNCNGTQFQKNVFTGDTLASSSSISFSTTSIVFTYSGARNTSGNTSFSRSLSCDGITVYNASSFSGTVTIYKSGTAPTGTYVKFDDIKNRLASSGYRGTLTFTLSTKNTYGTTKTSSKSISVDIGTAPNPVTGATISTSTSESTIYKKVFTGSYYFIPNGSGVVRVKWSGGSGQLGEAISYEVYVDYDDGTDNWQKIADVKSGTYYCNHTIPTQSSARSFKYLIRTKNAQGQYADAYTSKQTLHYYNSPGLSVGSITRASTSASIPVTVKSNTSIPGVTTVGTWQRFARGNTTSVQQSGTLTTSQSAQTISTSGLTDASQYDLKVTYNDNTGLSSNKTQTIVIGANSSVFFVNKYGIGVGGYKADSTYSLNVKGAVHADRFLIGAPRVDAESGTQSPPTGFTVRAGYNNGYPYNYGNAITINGGGSSQLFMAWSGISGGNAHLYYRSKRDTSDANWSGWATIYSTANKPTAADVGAIPTGGAITPGTAHIKAGVTSSGQDVSFTLDRNGASWRMLGTGGVYKIQTDWNGSKGSYFDVMSMHNTSGDVAINKGSLTVASNVTVGATFYMNNGRYMYWKNTAGANSRIIGFSSSNNILIGNPDDTSQNKTVIYGDEVEVEKYIRVDGRVFKGWAFTSKGTYWCGLSSDDAYLRMYNNSGSVMNNVTNLGSASGRFIKLFTVGAADVSSDIRYKENILAYDDKIEEFYSKLKPCSWTRIDGDSGRRHYGFIAQEVEEAMSEVGMGYKDMAFLQKAPLDKEGREIAPSTIDNYDTDTRIDSYEYSLGYTELISVNTHMVQKLQKENSNLKDRLSMLEEKMVRVLNKLEPIPEVKL